MIESQALLNTIAQALYDKKGSNILALDVRQISDLTDYCVIVEGNVDRHVAALTNHVTASTKEINQSPFFIEGLDVGEWVVIDFGDVIVHIMISEMRQKYALEDLWKAAKIVDLDIDVSNKAPGVNNGVVGYGYGE
jgi:ribosome-associated protein